MRTQAAGLGAGRDLDWDRACPFMEIGWSLKELTPDGIMANGTGARLGCARRFFEISQAHSRGS